MSPTKRRIMYDQIEEMLQAGVIEPSTAQYSSPPIIIERPGKKPRFCIDYRHLNEVTETEASVLPKIHDSIKDLGSSKIFTVLDLKSGYWQIPLEESSKDLSTFTTPDGAAYRFNVMPFGLKTAPCTFQKFMTRDVLTGHLHRFCKVYLDDIIIYSKNLSEHLVHLRHVFERLRLHNLKVSPAKCNVATSEIQYLGHLIKSNTTQPLEKHILQITSYQAPTTKRQLQSFLGLCNWVREYIPNAALITKPLTKLLAKDCRFKWTEDANTAFIELKDRLSTGQMELHRPVFNTKFYLQTDASMLGISAVLYQLGEEGERHIVSYASNTLTPAERRYHINELECLAIVTYVKKYKMYLADNPFVIRTDNRALLWLNKHRDDKTKFTRWSLLLQEYDFVIEHVAGKENLLADFLSRHPQQGFVETDDEEERMFAPNYTIPECISTLTHSELYQQVAETQARSKDVQDNVRRWNRLVHQRDRSDPDQNFYQSYIVQDGLLKRQSQGLSLLVVPKRKTSAIMYHYHDRAAAGHPGRDETVRKIAQRYFFNNMTRLVGQYIQNCIICKAVKAKQYQPHAPMRSHAPASPFEMLSVDIIGPLQKTQDAENRYILLVEDVFSKWIEVKAFPQIDGRHIAKFLDEEVIARYGLPRTIISDNGGHFNSGWYTTFCTRNKIEMLYIPAYHQQANPVERRVQECKKILKTLMYLQPNDVWDRYIHQMAHILRTRRNAATGQTPSQVVLGYDPAETGEWDLFTYRQERSKQISIPRLERVKETRKCQQGYQSKYAPTEAVTPVTYKVGDMVMNRRKRKDHTFAPAWSGPNKVIKKFSNEVYLIRMGHIATRVHVDDIRSAPAQRQDMEESSDEEEATPEDDASTSGSELDEPRSGRSGESVRIQVQVHADVEDADQRSHDDPGPDLISIIQHPSSTSEDKIYIIDS